MPNCTAIGLSSPRFSRMRAICSVFAASPARIAAGSPGVRRSIRKTSTATISRTGIVASRRRARKVYTGPQKETAPEFTPEPSRCYSSRSVLLQVPVDVAVGDEPAGDVLAPDGHVHEFAERRMRADLERARLDRLGELLLLRLVRLAHELRAQLFELGVGRPAEPAGLLALRLEPGLVDRAGDVVRLPRGQEHVPAALSRGVFLRAAPAERLPVHRLQVDLEARLPQQLRGHVGKLLDRRQVGGLHQITGVPS